MQSKEDNNVIFQMTSVLCWFSSVQ